MENNFIKNLKFKNKKIYILGGSGLLGSEVLKELAVTEGRIIVLDLKFPKKKIIKNKKNYENIKFVNFDCSKLNNIEFKIKKIFKKYGCPNIFINCTYPSSKNWIKSNFEQNKISILRENVDIHLNSYSWISYKVCEQMKKEKIKGSVIMLSSIYGFLGQNMEMYKNTKMRENMNYSIIKGGIINLTRQLASYYGKFNIRVNTVSPGGIIGSAKGLSKTQDINFVKNYSKLTPLKRMGKPEEVASAIIFLASDSSSYITGSNLIIDGGWSII